MKAKLEKAKEAARATKAIVEASKQRSYNLGVQETKGRMTKELAGVYREYCQEVWTEALNLAGVPAASKLRKAKNIYYPQDLHKAPAALLSPRADAVPAATAHK